MGASDTFQGPAGTHSTDGVESLSTLRSRMCEPLTDEGDGEFFCPHCESRCTRSPDGGREYGHALDCERRSEQRSRHTAGEPVVVGPDTSDEPTVVTDGGWVETPDTTFCPDCQRERISCAHLAADTEGQR